VELSHLRDYKGRASEDFKFIDRLVAMVWTSADSATLARLPARSP